MKHISLTCFLFAISISFSFAGSPCVIDSSNTDFFSPRPDSLPCVERTVAYNQVIQIAVPSSINLQDFGSPIPFLLYVDSVVITGVNGLPNGILYDAYPASGVFYGGGYGCALVSGTTSDPAGRYPITFNGTFTAHGAAFPPFFDGDTTIDFATLQNLSQGMFDLFLDVIEPGATCRPVSGIAGSSLNDNVSFNVFPNPVSDLLKIEIVSALPLTGDLKLTDPCGRTVLSEKINSNGVYTSTCDIHSINKGVYFVIISTNEGTSSKTIVIN